MKKVHVRIMVLSAHHQWLKLLNRRSKPTPALQRMGLGILCHHHWLTPHCRAMLLTAAQGNLSSRLLLLLQVAY
jgi:hypothetical protein